MYSLHFLRKWKHLFIFMLTLKRILELNRGLGDNETWSKEAKCFNPSQLVVVVRSAPSRWEAQRSKSALLLLTPVGDILHWPLVLPSVLVCDDATVQAEWQWHSCGRAAGCLTVKYVWERDDSVLVHSASWSPDLVKLFDQKYVCIWK